MSVLSSSRHRSGRHARPRGSVIALVSAFLVAGCTNESGQGFRLADIGKPPLSGELPVPTAGSPPIRRQATYRIKPGDSLAIHVFDNPDLNQTVIVGPDGRFSFPLVGTVRAEGKSLAAVDAYLTERLRRNILEPQVAVTLSQVAPRRIYVTGEVLAPGSFDVSEPVSVVQAISMAGGFTAFADRRHILVYNPARSRNARRVFDYDAFLANPGAYDFALGPGDTVIVR